MRPSGLGEPLQTASLREQAIQVIRAAMVAGKVRPGVIYSAAGLATELGVSSSPVREAMLTLVSEGLLEPVRNRGFRVAPLTENDLDEIYGMRLMLEVPTIGEVAARATDKELKQLGALAADVQDAAEAGDIHRFLDGDRQFHLELLALAGNRRVVDTVAALRDQTRLYAITELAESYQLGPAATEHAELLDVLTVRDGDHAQELMRKHLGHTRGAWARQSRG